MAGRGTDITLGEGVPELGGLAILGTGTSAKAAALIIGCVVVLVVKAESRFSFQFFLSWEDDLMRIFGADNITGIMDKLGMEEDEPIEHSFDY